MKNEVKATFSQLKGVFKAHGNLANGGDGLPHNLLRFYANECGLKALYLRENNLNDTSEFTQKPGVRYGHGHDLIRWIDELKIPHFVLNIVDDPDDPLIKVHEKLRYGVSVRPGHVKLLRSLQALIKRTL